MCRFSTTGTAAAAVGAFLCASNSINKITCCDRTIYAMQSLLLLPQDVLSFGTWKMPILLCADTHRKPSN